MPIPSRGNVLVVLSSFTAGAVGGIFLYGKFVDNNSLQMKSLQSLVQNNHKKELEVINYNQRILTEMQTKLDDIAAK